MSDEKTVEPTQQAAPTPQPEQAAPFFDMGGRKKRDFVSIGETIHNELTYRGVDWLLNSTFGVMFAVWTARTKSGAKYFAEPVGKFFNFVLKPFFQTEKGLEVGVKWGITYLSIMFGGTVTVPPLVLMENHKNKKAIVKGIDTLIYGKDKVENDPKFAKAYQEIEEQPKKDFWTGTAARYITLAPLFTMTLYRPTHEVATKFVYAPLARAVEKVATKLHIKPGKFLSEIRPDQYGNKDTNWKYMFDTIGFDFGQTVFYCVLHEFTYKLLARANYNHHERKEKQEYERRLHDPRGEHPAASPALAASSRDEQPEKPATRIAQVENLSRVDAGATLQQAGV